MRSTPPAPAVFVDPTGRRRRFARRAAVLFAVPATGYVGLLVSTMLGGPSLDTPLIPVPDAVRPESRQHQVDERTVPDGPSGTVGPGQAGPTRRETTSPTPATISGSPQRPSGTPTQVPSTPARPTTLPTQVPSTPGPTSTPGSKPGRTNSPTQRPTHTPRGPGAN